MISHFPQSAGSTYVLLLKPYLLQAIVYLRSFIAGEGKAKISFFLVYLSSPFQIITVEEAKRRKSTCSYYEDEDEAALPILQPHSALLENMHIEQVGSSWGLRMGVFQTLEHIPHPWHLLFSLGVKHEPSFKGRNTSSLTRALLCF